MKAYVDKETCIGCEVCVTICPDVFSMDEDDLAVAIDGDIPEDIMDACEEAKDSCPTDSISIE